MTFKTTVTSTTDFLTITWSLNKDQVVSIITHVPSTNTVEIDVKYTSRIRYNTTTCELQLGPLTKEDEGEYILSLVTTKAKTLTGEINLEVLGKY